MACPCPSNPVEKPQAIAGARKGGPRVGRAALSSLADACAQSDNGCNSRINYEPQTQTSLRALNGVLPTSRDHVGDRRLRLPQF